MFKLLITTKIENGHSTYTGSYGGGWKVDNIALATTTADFETRKEADAAFDIIQNEKNSRHTAMKLYK
jgi:hypothetical protein